MTHAFRRFAGACALLAALAGVVFTVAFAVVVQNGDRWAAWLSWVTLLAGGLVTIPVVVALHAVLGEVEPQFALVGLIVGVAGALGAAVHGAYDIAVLANPPTGPDTGLPSAIDPRGAMTFAVTGLALLLFGWLILRTGLLPGAAGGLGVGGGLLLLVVYVGRLTVMNPKTNVIRIAALASGLVVVPGFYLLVGRSLLDRRTVPASAGPGDAS
jgi:hypothetical protein